MLFGWFSFPGSCLGMQSQRLRLRHQESMAVTSFPESLLVLLLKELVPYFLPILLRISPKGNLTANGLP
jgi:hypothetical protein